MTQSSHQPLNKLPTLSWALLTILAGLSFVYHLQDTYDIVVSNDTAQDAAVQTVPDWIGWFGWLILICVFVLHISKDATMRERLGVLAVALPAVIGSIIRIATYVPYVGVVLIVMEIITILLAITAIIVWHNTTKYETQETQETDET